MRGKMGTEKGKEDSGEKEGAQTETKQFGRIRD